MLTDQAKNEIRQMLDWHPDRAQALLDAIDGNRINGGYPVIDYDGCGCIIAHVADSTPGHVSRFNALQERLITDDKAYAAIEKAVIWIRPNNNKDRDTLAETRAEVVAWMARQMHEAAREALTVA